MTTESVKSLPLSISASSGKRREVYMQCSSFFAFPTPCLTVSPFYHVEHARWHVTALDVSEHGVAAAARAELVGGTQRAAVLRRLEWWCLCCREEGKFSFLVAQPCVCGFGRYLELENSLKVLLIHDAATDKVISSLFTPLSLAPVSSGLLVASPLGLWVVCGMWVGVEGHCAVCLR